MADRFSQMFFDVEMSFPPPGPPMPMPGMPPVPPMMPPPYAVPPMGGMIPMTVGMMPAPMMAPVAMTVPPSMSMAVHQKSPIKKHPMPAVPYKRPELQPQEPKGPPVTVFVGNITERASDSLIRQLLQKCGSVVNWKRVQGANGKLQAFGFCEYGDPESGLRAIRLLHDWQIGDKKLVVKVDAKTKEKLDEYKATKWANQKDENEEKKEDDKEKDKSKDATKSDDVDETTKNEDEEIKNAINEIIQEHSLELSRPVETKEAVSPTEKQRKITKVQEVLMKMNQDAEKDPKNDLDEMDLEEEKKSLIHREIDKFRDTYKRAEEEKEKERERKERDNRSKDRNRDRDSKDRDRKSTSRRERTPLRDRDHDRIRDREREHERSPLERNRVKDRAERLATRSRSRSRDRAWSQERERSRERSRDKDVDKDREDEEDAYERKKLERKLREKEAAYQERLRNWEARERRKGKDYDKARQKEEDQKQEELKEARRLKEFLEDYDDERDDPKYYKGSALARRLKEREKEIEADNHDRRKEKEELEELRRQLVEKGHPDPDGEIDRIHQEEQAKLFQPKVKPEPSDSEGEQEHISKMRPIASKETVPEEETKPIKRPIEDESPPNSLSGFSDVITTQEESKPLGFGVLRLGSSPTQLSRSPSTNNTTNSSNNNNSTNNTNSSSNVNDNSINNGSSNGGSTSNSNNNNQSGQKKKMTLQEVFNDDDSSEQRKKRKLIPLDDVQEESKTSSGSQQMSTEEKRKHIKNLIDKIPTDKEKLFAFNLDWSLVDKSLMERKIKPWINKKIVEYIGEEEPTLVEFICSKVLAGSAAQSILDDVSMVLDEEAEVFVVKMWRLLIYEIESKKLGLMR
ncbi:RNA-binding protein 25 isoform X2 [Centruroides vittatus]|uniref:RNA-binding protein 25 isoform X2 n=1 Tax=Centruroides vittatus TaxID=120091 RepID=UPI00350F21D0